MIQLYAIFDKKGVCFMPPFQAKHVAEATRNVSSAMEADTPLKKWPGDFSLHLIGTFDPSTGYLMQPSSGGPQLVMECAALLPVERQVANG